MKKYIFIAYIFIFQIWTNLFGQTGLYNYLEIAAENNPAIRARYEAYLAAMELIPQVGSLPDPEITFGYFIQPIETRVGPQQAKFSLTQMFPWFGTLGAREDEAIEKARMKYEEFADSKALLFFNVKRNYYNLYALDQTIRITQSNLGILTSINDIVLVKIESGITDAVDALRIEMEKDELLNDMNHLQDLFNTSTLEFYKMLNINEDGPVLLPDTLWSEDIFLTKEVILQQILAGNHQLRQLDYLAASYSGKEKVARKAGWPGFSLGLEYISTGENDNMMSGANLSGKDALVFPKIGMSLPLYRTKYSSMEKEAVYMYKAAQSQRTDKMNTLEYILNSSFDDYNDARRRIDLYQRQKQRAEKSLYILRTVYEAYGTNFDELLNMERTLLKYHLELEQARTDKNTAVAYISYLMGEHQSATK
jgi:cobalt-zinc-cadmium efflux system outer membrane protein